MNLHRIIPLTILGAGLLILLGVGAGILPGAASLGIMIMIFGFTVYLLSFVQEPEAQLNSQLPAFTTAERVLSTFYQPARLFQNLRIHPNWVPAFLILALSITLYNVAFVKRVGAGTIAAATIDKVLEGGFMSKEDAAEIRAASIQNAETLIAQLSSVVGGIFGWFVFMLLVASLYLIGVAMFGGEMNYLQALSVAMYAALPPFVTQKLLSLLLLYLIPRDDINPISAQAGLARIDLGLLFAPATHPVLYVAGTAISMFSAYWFWLTMIGLRHGAAQLSAGYTWTICISIWVMALVLALLLGALFPTFIV